MSERTPRRRIAVIVGLVALVFSLFILRLLQLQVIKADEYLLLAQGGSVRYMAVPAARGEIVDRNGVPLAQNRVGFDIVIDRAGLKSKTQNDTILALCDILSDSGEMWNDSLPIRIVSNQYRFTDSASSVAVLLKRLELNPDATAGNAMDWLRERYAIGADLSVHDARTIAGVRYEMELRDFSLTIPFTLASDVSERVVARILEHSATLPGVVVNEVPVRTYPDGTIAPHIVGAIGPLFASEYKTLKEQGYRMNDTIGRDGIEQALESELRGQEGIIRLELDRYGTVVDTRYDTLPQPGRTVRLTIDAQLQRRVQEGLELRIRQYNEAGREGMGRDASAGAAVVVEVQTGEVLAAATWPSYDLASYYSDYVALASDPATPLYNRAFLGRYAPGSCFKPGVAVAALSEGATTASTRVNCTGSYSVGGLRFKCSGAHGSIDLYRAITVSCNTYFYEMGRRMGADTIASYLVRMGQGVKTGVEVPETAGVLATAARRKEQGRPWSTGDSVQMAIGQSDTLLSPLQMAVSTAAIATDGKCYETTLVRAVTSYDGGTTHRTHTPKLLNEIDSPDAFAQVKRAMVNVSRVGTTRRAFATYEMDVGTKTGTPQVTGGSNNAVLIGYAPADDPQIAVCIVVEHGGGGYLLEHLMRYIFDAYFYPDEEPAPFYAAAVDDALLD